MIYPSTSSDPSWSWPSSSHTAGACRSGSSQALLGASPTGRSSSCTARSARTGQDTAPTGHRRGLLGFRPDDERLRDSVELAASSGLKLTFRERELRGEHHPNTARLTLSGKGSASDHRRFLDRRAGS